MTDQTAQIHPGTNNRSRPRNPYARRRGPDIPKQRELSAAVTAPASDQKSAISFVVIAFLISLIIPATFSVGPIAMSVLRLVLLLSFVPAFLMWASGKAGRILAPDIWLLLFCSWVLVSIGVLHGMDTIEFSGINLLECFGAYLLGRVYIRNARQFGTMVKWFGIVILLTIPIALYEALTGVALMSRVLQAVPFLNGPVDVITDIRLGLNRAQGPFETPIHMGLLCACAFVLLYMAGPEKRTRLGNRVWSGISLFGSFLALSSGPLLALLTQMLLLGWDWFFRKIKIRWHILVSLFILAYVLVDLFAARPPLNVFLQYATFNSGSAWWRVSAFTAGIENIQSSPIIGIGLNDWKRPAWMHSSSVDNYWLLITMRHGIPAFVFMALAFLTAIFSVARSKNYPDKLSNNVRLAWTYLFISLIIVLITVHIWTVTYSLVFFLMGSGMWLAVKPKVREPDVSSSPSQRI